MSHYNQAPEGKDPALWEIAQKRAGFKRHALVYFIVNAFLWTTWFMRGHVFHSGIWDGDHYHFNFPWPLWTTIGWGIGLAFHFAGAYIYPKANSVEREYEKLKNKQNN